MKYKIIEVVQNNAVCCDYCDYKVANDNPTEIADVSEYVNKPCPDCGNNLCTPKDFLEYLHLTKTIHKANKWFGWLRYFFGSKELDMNLKN